MGTWPAITMAAGMAAVAPQGMSQSRAKKRRKGSRENVREEEDGERREKKGKREGSMCRGPHETQSDPPPTPLGDTHAIHWIQIWNNLPNGTEDHDDNNHNDGKTILTILALMMVMVVMKKMIKDKIAHVKSYHSIGNLVCKSCQKYLPISSKHNIQLH